MFCLDGYQYLSPYPTLEATTAASSPSPSRTVSLVNSDSLFISQPLSFQVVSIRSNPQIHISASLRSFLGFSCIMRKESSRENKGGERFGGERKKVPRREGKWKIFSHPLISIHSLENDCVTSFFLESILYKGKMPKTYFRNIFDPK